MNKKRYTIPDIIRGFALLEMIIYHALWDIVFIFGIDIEWFKETGTYIWQQSICWTFILLSGFCINFSHHKIKRGLIVIICSLIISIVTILITPDSSVRFGVLFLIGTGMLLSTLLDKLPLKSIPVLSTIISFCLFCLTRNVPWNYLGFGCLCITKMPEILYQNDFTASLGFPPQNFFSSDYFPLIPWIFLYNTGYFIYHIFKKYDFLNILSVFSFFPLEWFGRHSLIIYMLHQPIIYGILWLTLGLK